MLCTALGIRLALVATALTALATLASPRLAHADEPHKTDHASTARALFSDARKLVDAGEYSAACPKFEESLRLNVGLGTQFNLADCWEHIGRTASARELFLGAAATARATGQKEREQVAQARADALEPRLVRILIDVRATDKELVVRRNQVNVEHSVWGTATPIDPGTYVIEASAPHKKTWSTRVTIPVTTMEEVTIVVPQLEDAAAFCEKPAEPAESVPERPMLKASALPPPVTSGPVDPAPRSKRRTAYALSLTAFGVASVVAGTVLFFDYRSKNKDAQGVCPSSMNCSAAEIDSHSSLVSDAKTFRTWSFVGFGVGGAALAGAAVLYFGPRSSSRASGLSAAPFVSADGSWGAIASGRF